MDVAVGKPQHHTFYCFLLQCDMLQAWLSSITIHLDYCNTSELFERDTAAHSVGNSRLQHIPLYEVLHLILIGTATHGCVINCHVIIGKQVSK